MRRAMRFLRLEILALVLVASWACIQRPMMLPKADTRSSQAIVTKLSPSKDVDILFLVDSSGSMAQEQTELKNRFDVLMQTLAGGPEGLPDVHIGVITPSIGIAPNTGLGNCDPSSSDKGILGMAHGAQLGPDLAQACIGEGQRYIVDVRPQGCAVERDQGRCLSDVCAQAQCDAMAKAGERLVLVHDENGCPRCRNYEGKLEDVFRCLASVGDSGCGFEQQLEAVRMALDTSVTPQNEGFVRDGALLAVVFITDEDDCSAAKPDILFRPDNDAGTCVASELGCRDNLRCFEFGMVCDQDVRQVGAKTNCRLRDESDPSALLTPISRYVAFFESKFDPDYTLIASISGPVTDQVQIEVNSNGHPDVGPSCAQGGGWEATPAFRIQAFLEAFYQNSLGSSVPAWAVTNICSGDFTSAMTKIAESINTKLAPRFAMPLAGHCREGAAGMSCGSCLPQCRVRLVAHRGGEDQKGYQVPWCGALCKNGLCTASDLQPCSSGEGESCLCDAPLSAARVGSQVGCVEPFFAAGIPDSEVEPDLASVIAGKEPSCTGTDCDSSRDGLAAACWYVGKDEGGMVTVKVAGAKAFEPWVRAEITCKLVPDKEPLCRDGKDNDEDCLVDEQDPDCSMPADGPNDDGPVAP